MSYRNFRDEVLEELGRTLKSGERESIWSALGGRISRAVNRKSAWSAWSEKVMRTLPDAQRVVFWRWFKAERYPELVYWLVDNFDTGGGDEYLDSLSERLSELREVQLLTRLWRGSISNRRRAKKRNEVVSAYQRFARALSICGLASDRAAALEELQRFRDGKPPKSIPTTDKRLIDDAVFWQLIDASRLGSFGIADQATRITVALQVMNARAIRRFRSILGELLERANTWDVWALACIARNGCGDDEFEYFRAWLIAQGETSYKGVLVDVGSGADIINRNQDPQGEPLLYAADQAYENKTGKILTAPLNKGRSPRGAAWREVDLPIAYPRLWEAFNSTRNAAG